MENYTIKVLGPTWDVDEWPTRVRCQHESSDDDMRWYVPERTCKMMKISGDDGYTFVCSECNRPISYFAKDKYCPHCGARVVGD